MRNVFIRYNTDGTYSACYDSIDGEWSTGKSTAFNALRYLVPDPNVYTSNYVRFNLVEGTINVFKAVKGNLKVVGARVTVEFS